MRIAAKIRVWVDTGNLAKQIGNTMNRRSNNIKIFLRLYAAGCLLVWLAAITVCTSENFCIPEHCDSSSVTHHDESAPAHHQEGGDSENHQPHDYSFCDSLKTIAQTAPQPVLAKPAFRVSDCDLFSLTISSFLTPLAASNSQVLRQPQDAKLLFKPEVFLGPAFRSLAPPRLV